MAVIVAAVFFGLAHYALAWRANRCLLNERRLPMQWGLNGAVTWSAPRRAALAFMPVVGIGLLMVQVVMHLTLAPGRVRRRWSCRS